MLSNCTEVTKDHVLNEVNAVKHQGYRFVTMTGVDMGTHFDIYYHFDKDYELKNFYLKLGKDENLESISGVYFAAVLVENELQDLFGLKVVDMAIDYKERLLKTEDALEAPFRKPIPSAPAAPTQPASEVK